MTTANAILYTLQIFNKHCVQTLCCPPPYSWPSNPFKPKMIEGSAKCMKSSKQIHSCGGFKRCSENLF